MEAVVIRITRETMLLIIRSLPSQVARADFAFACLTTAYTGENWYFVNPTRSADVPKEFEKRIISQATLDKTYDYVPPSDEGTWFIARTK